MSKRTSSPTSVSEDASASKKPKLEIVNDLEAMALEEAKLYPTAELRNAALVAIGIPDGTKYEDAQVKDHKAAGTHVSAKEKDLPDWCFLQLCPADYVFPEGTSAAGKKKINRRMFISQDGINISTRLLKPKRMALSTMTVFGKQMTMTILPSTIPKLVTLLACSPKVNGNGVINV